MRVCFFEEGFEEVHEHEYMIYGSQQKGVGVSTLQGEGGSC